MNSSQPLAASGERRVGTIGNIISRIAQSLTISSVVQKPVVSMLGIGVISDQVISDQVAGRATAYRLRITGHLLISSPTRSVGQRNWSRNANVIGRSIRRLPGGIGC